MKTIIINIAVHHDQIIFWYSGDATSSRFRMAKIDLPEAFPTAKGYTATRIMLDAILKRFPTGQLQFPGGSGELLQETFDEEVASSRALDDFEAGRATWDEAFGRLYAADR